MPLSRKTKRRLVLLAALLAIPVAVAAYWALKNKSHRFFRATPNVAVALNGVPVSDASVYRSGEGVWLIDLNRGNEWYAYTDDDSMLYTCKQPWHLSLPRSLLLVKDEVLPCIPFSPVKAFDPHLTVTRGSIEFDSHEHRGRIRVTWS
jgi:hypothetical protein